jgi:hypothetical protein
MFGPIRTGFRIQTEDRGIADTRGIFGGGGVMRPVQIQPAPNKSTPWIFRAPAESLTAKANRQSRESEMAREE